MLQPRISYLTLGVRDLPAMRRFYTETFGWKPRPESQEEVAFFQLNGMVLALWGWDSLAEDAQADAQGSGFRGFALAYNVSSEAEVDRLFAQLTAKGARAAKPPQKVFWGGYTAYVADPEDNLWELAYNPHLELDPNGWVK